MDRLVYIQCIHRTTDVNSLLLQFEHHTGLGATKASRLMGLAYVTYAQCRAGSRPLQLYHERHVQALMLLPRASLDKLIKEHTNAS